MKVTDDKKFKDSFQELVKSHKNSLEKELVEPKHDLIKYLTELIYKYYETPMSREWMQEIFESTKSLDASLAIFSATMQLIQVEEKVKEDKQAKQNRRSFRRIKNKGEKIWKTKK